MYLKKLHISNFRCFEDYTIEFAPRVTVLFGKNGSGKTTLIHAIHKAMSFMMYWEDVKEKAPKGKKANVIETKSLRLRNPYPPKYENFSEFDFKDYEYAETKDSSIEINAEADFVNTNVENGMPLSLAWSMIGSAPRYSVKPSGFKSAFNKLYEEYTKVSDKPQLPLFAYYSDGFPHNTMLNQSKSTEKDKREYHLKCDYPELGYTDWHTEKGFTNVWLDRLATKQRRLLSIPKEKDGIEQLFIRGKIDWNEKMKRLAKNEMDFLLCSNEVSKITKCLKLFFEKDPYFEVDSLDIDTRDLNEECVVTTKGDKRPFNVLPAGYKRLFYIVLDIAYRSLLLSGGKSTDIPGIAIIDEIDLHLHPELEKVVLQRFMKTFTKVQFIISTHSFLVLSGLSTVDGKSRIMRMEPRQEDPSDSSNQRSPLIWNDIYGLDVNSTMQEVMEVNPSDDELTRWISHCAYMMSKGFNEQAAMLKQFISEKNLISEEEIEKRIKTVLDKITDEIH